MVMDRRKFIGSAAGVAVYVIASETLPTTRSPRRDQVVRRALMGALDEIASAGLRLRLRFRDSSGDQHQVFFPLETQRTADLVVSFNVEMQIERSIENLRGHVVSTDGSVLGEIQFSSRHALPGDTLSVSDGSFDMSTTVTYLS